MFVFSVKVRQSPAESKDETEGMWMRMDCGERCGLDAVLQAPEGLWSRI